MANQELPSAVVEVAKRGHRNMKKGDGYTYDTTALHSFLLHLFLLIYHSSFHETIFMLVLLY